jgi:hypothetical protein
MLESVTQLATMEKLQKVVAAADGEKMLVKSENPVFL